MSKEVEQVVVRKRSFAKSILMFVGVFLVVALGMGTCTGFVDGVAQAHEYGDRAHHEWTLRVAGLDLEFPPVVAERGSLAEDAWTSWREVDEFTGKMVVSAVSPTVRGEPYKHAWMGATCFGGERVVWTLRLGYLNPSDTGWSNTRRYARVGTLLTAEGMPPVRGGTVLWLLRDGKSLRADHKNTDYSLMWMLAADEYAIRIPWYHSTPAEIRFPLQGAREHIGGVLAACGRNERTPKGLRHVRRHAKRDGR